MTVCGIKHADGVCVIGKCPHIKKCCPTVWDKSGVPMTNEEWLHTLNTEEKAFALETIIRSVLVLRSPMCHDVCNREFWERWLKEKHNDL